MTGPAAPASPPVIPLPRGEDAHGVLSVQDLDWITATVAALPPPTVEEITGWCDILAHLEAKHPGTRRTRERK